MDLGSVTYFLGVEVLSHPQGLFLSQKRYISDLLSKANMDDAKVAATPLVVYPPLITNGYSVNKLA